MLTYQIKSHKATPNPYVQVDTVKDLLTRHQILVNNLNRCHFKIGDCVKFKKPKKNPAYGEIIHIEDDHNKVTFSHGGVCPMNITVRVGSQEVKTNMKKLLYVHQKGPV